MTPRYRDESDPRARTWAWKFGCAFRGIKRAVRSDSNFFVHFFAAAAVVAAGIVLELSRTEWCVLLLCIGLVLVTETMNTALEWIAQAVTDQFNPLIRDALDMASGAVLLAAITAATVGLAIFVHRLGVMLNWWPVG
jgi:diacylglycerol kinase